MKHYNLLLFFWVQIAFSQIGIGTTSPDASAILDIQSSTNNQGVLLPRLTKAQIEAIVSPATGLMVYCTTTNKIAVNAGTPSSPSWKQLVYENLGSLGFKNVYSYTGSDQSFTVPSGVTSLNVKIWGAGGGGSYGSGGSGAFISGTLTVTPGQTLIIAVGKGGGYSTSGVAGGYGGGASSGPGGGSGGGYSGIFNNSVSLTNTLVICGGGGGGGYFDFSTYGGGGGATTGISAGNYSASYTGGTGGTTSTGGAGGIYNGSPTNPRNGTAGTALQGGSGNAAYSYGGGGGGGGYYGGGGGYGGNSPSFYSSGGGGGSSYYSGSFTLSSNVAGNIDTSGNIVYPPSNTDPDYITGIAIGGGVPSGTEPGGNGLVVISY